MITKIFVPPFGIQKTYIACTFIGNLSLLYNINNPFFKNLSGAGTNINKKRAEELSKYEAIERIGNTINTQQVIPDTYINLKDKCYDLNKFPQVLKEELSPNIKFLPEQIIGWIQSVNLVDSKVYLIPQSYVYLYSKNQYLGDNMTNPISTGVALHDDYTNAIISGIYEVVERDGIALTWLLQNVKYRINHIFDDEYHRVFSSKFLGEVNYYDVSTVDGIITICAHAKAQFSKNAKNVLMFASDTCIEKIKTKLYKELVSVMSTFALSENYSESTDYSSFTSVDQSGSFMAQEFNDRHFNFFNSVSNNENIKYEMNSFSSAQEELKYLKNLFKKLNYDILITEITTREAKKRKLKVVRVLIPQLQPISFVYKSKYLDSQRLNDMKKVKEIQEINQMPLAFS